MSFEDTSRFGRDFTAYHLPFVICTPGHRQPIPRLGTSLPHGYAPVDRWALAQDGDRVAELERLAQEIAAATGRAASDCLATLFAHLRINLATDEELPPVDQTRCVATSRDKPKKLGTRRRADSDEANSL